MNTYVLDGNNVREVEENESVALIHSPLTVAYLKNDCSDVVVENILSAIEVVDWVIGTPVIAVEGIGKGTTFKVAANNHVHFIHGMYAHSEFVTRLLENGYQFENKDEWDGNLVFF